MNSLVGRSIDDVGYLIPDTSDTWRIKHHRGFDEASMGIDLRLDRGTCEMKWLMHGEREGLALVLDPDESDYQRDRVKRVPVGDSPEWRRLMGTEVAAVGVAWHQPVTGTDAVWAIRLSFLGGNSVVVALGEWREEALRYIPDAVVAIFDPVTANAYQILAGEEPAWGHDTPDRS